MRLTCLAALAAVAGSATLAAPASAVRFAVLGDWGAGSSSQVAIAKRMCAVHGQSRFGFILTTGDNFYPQGTATPETFDDPERCLNDAGIPWRAVWGNHDVPGESTATVLKSPRRWYTFLAGGVRIIALDANQPQSSAQLAFLRSALEAETVRPVIVAYHQGTRTAGLHPPQTSQQRVWEPLFIKHKVRLVLQGHNHLYERIAYRGVTYITSGGGGAPLYPCVRRTAGLVKCTSVNNFLVIEATPRKVGVRAFDRNGRVIDRVRFDFSPPPPS